MHQIDASKNQRVCIELLHVGNASPPQLGSPHKWRDVLYHCAGQLFLQGENVGHSSVEALRPQTQPCGRARELRGDAELVAGSSDGAFEDGIDPELTPDVARRHARFAAELEMHLSARRLGVPVLEGRQAEGAVGAPVLAIADAREGRISPPSARPLA